MPSMIRIREGGPSPLSSSSSPCRLSSLNTRFADAGSEATCTFTEATPGPARRLSSNDLWTTQPPVALLGWRP